MNNKTEYEIVEIFTMIFGRCYLIKKIIEVPVFDYNTVFYFKMNWDVQLYIHNPGKIKWQIGHDMYNMKNYIFLKMSYSSLSLYINSIQKLTVYVFN